MAFARAATDGGTSRKERDHWKRVASEIRREILEEGVDPKRDCFVQAYGLPHMDASLLLLPIVGFVGANERRMKNTIREIEKRLLYHGLVLRYETTTGIDGLAGSEGAFLACSFWLVDNYLLQGRRRDAEKLYQRLVRLANDVGLLAEEYDPRARRMLGNFPQAFSHVALVNSGINLMHGQAMMPKRKGRRRSHVVRHRE